MPRYFFLCIAAALHAAVIAAALAEENGKWELEQRGRSLFALSYKQSASINNQTVTSELGFLCDQRNRMGVIGAILVPFDGTFENRRDPIPVSIQKKSDVYDRPDLLQKWKNGNEFLFLEVPDDVADLVTLLKEKDAGSDRSIHFYFPNGSVDQQTTNHIAIDSSEFASKFEEFEKSCNSSQ